MNTQRLGWFVERRCRLERSGWAAGAVLVAGALLAVLLSGCSSLSADPEAPITAQERAAIEAVVRKATPETIIAIKRESWNTVEVNTGFIMPGRLEGTGHTFSVKRLGDEWEIDEERLWLSTGKPESAGGEPGGKTTSGSPTRQP